jgi:hypothetical protein
MTDRELLELAAKAAGYGEGVYISDSVLSPLLILGEYPNDFSWMPLTDDGDCARLEVACELNVNIGDLGVLSEHSEGMACFERYTDHDNDRNKTRRYASVGAAAEIAKYA